MEYILSGNPNDVQKVIQENRIRSQRGVIKFTPLADAPSREKNHKDNEPEIEALKKELAERNEAYEIMSNQLSEACFRANDLQVTINRIKEAGVDIDLILDTPAEACDEKTEPEADTKVEPETDTKVEPEADAKAEPEPDVKTEPEADTKTTKAKRTKKSE